MSVVDAPVGCAAASRMNAERLYRGGSWPRNKCLGPASPCQSMHAVAVHAVAVHALAVHAINAHCPGQIDVQTQMSVLPSHYTRLTDILIRLLAEGGVNAISLHCSLVFTQDCCYATMVLDTVLPYATAMSCVMLSVIGAPPTSHCRGLHLLRQNFCEKLHYSLWRLLTLVCLLTSDLRLRLLITGMEKAYQPVVDVADGMLSYG